MGSKGYAGAHAQCEKNQMPMQPLPREFET
jgi:hypothetical protein